MSVLLVIISLLTYMSAANMTGALSTPTKIIQHTQGVSLQSFLASLIGSASVFGLEVVFFILLKNRFAQV